jgi:hypothetical protein
MITNKRVFILGCWIMVIPLLGLPLSWKFTLIILTGFGMIITSVKLHLPTKPINIKGPVKRKDKFIEKSVEKNTIDFMDNGLQKRENFDKQIETI